MISNDTDGVQCLNKGNMGHERGEKDRGKASAWPRVQRLNDTSD